MKVDCQMKWRRFQMWAWSVAMLGGATMFQACSGTPSAGDYNPLRFFTNSAGSAIDFCWLLDCQNGFFGGLVDPCADPSMGGWLLDCPGGVASDDTTTP